MGCQWAHPMLGAGEEWRRRPLQVMEADTKRGETSQLKSIESSREESGGYCQMPSSGHLGET